MNLSISFLDNRNPKFMSISATCEYKLKSFVTFLLSWKTIVNDNVTPFVVLEESNDVHTILPQVMEHRWIKTLTHLLSFFITNLTIVITRWIEITTNISILSCQHTERTNEPTITNFSLDNIICCSTIVKELRSFIR